MTKCPNCGFDSPAGMHYCGRCGTHLVQICLNCRFANPLDFLYCGMCGTRLAEPAAGLPVLTSFPAPLEALPTALTGGIPPVAIQPLPSPKLFQATPVTPFTPGISSLPEYFVTPLEGERRVATALLADVRSSINMLEQIGTETWVEIMNHVFQIMEAEIDRFGGQVDQFRGDGLVAFFGSKTAHEDDPERAILAALVMQERLKNYAENLMKSRQVDLKLRVGINTGELIVATVGAESTHQEDTAMGEAVALAARMEQSAEPGTVLVAENTYHLTETRFQWETLGSISVKGLSQPVKIYRPLAPKSEVDSEARALVQKGRVVLAGRGVQYQTLRQTMTELASGRGGIVFVTGEKGIGKTFLINQLRQELTQQGSLAVNGVDSFQPEPARTKADLVRPAPAQFTWIRGVCRSYDQSWPYSMWQDMLNNWLGIVRPGRSSEEYLRLRQNCEALWGKEAERYYPYLSALLALPLDDEASEKVRHLSAEGLRRQIFLAVRSWIEALVERHPVVLAFTDVHWADQASLDLLRYCLPVCDSHALLWLVIFRPDRTSPIWNFRHYIQTEFPHRLTIVEIPPLSEAESSEMIQQILGPQGLSKETCDLVIQKAEGNPYYIEELIRSLIAQGALERDKTGEWREIRQVTSLDLPDSLQSLITARLDRLTLDERRILQIAAVIGSVFWRNVLQALVEDFPHADPLQLQSALTNLQKAQFVVERSQAPELGMEYAFVSSLIREVVYLSLLSAQRKAYHLRVAEVLEELFSATASEYHGSLIAYHYRHAGNHNRELYYTLQAAEQASKVYANSEALTLYSRALELLNEMENGVSDKDRLFAIYSQRFDVLLGRSRIYYMLANKEAGDEDSLALLALAEKMGDDLIWTIDALLNHPQVRAVDNRADLPNGLALAERALILARQINDRRREIYSLLVIANIYIALGDSRWHQIGDQVLSMGRELGDQHLEAELLLGLGSAYGLDNLEQSMKYLEAALPICEKLNDKSLELSLLHMLGEKYERKGDYYRQLTEFEGKRLSIAREIGDRYGEGDALMYNGQLQGLYLGDYEAGLASLNESLRCLETITMRIYPLLRITQIHLALGNFVEAQAALETARPYGERTVNLLGQVGLLLVEMIYLNATGEEENLKTVLNLAEAVDKMVANKEVSRQYMIGAACEAADACYQLAQLYQIRQAQADQQDYLQRAAAFSQKAVDIYQEFGFLQMIECLSEELYFRQSQIALELHQTDLAQSAIERAYQEMMRKHDLIPVDSPYRRTFLENILVHRQIRAAYEGRNKPAQ